MITTLGEYIGECLSSPWRMWNTIGLKNERSHEKIHNQKGEKKKKMEKMNLPLKQFLTLVGPAQALEIIEEDATEPVFEDKAVKIRDRDELLDREVKHIQPAADAAHAGRYIIRIWIY